MNVTIKDIAKIANVSHTTVSRALNDNPNISEMTKEKIKKIAADLGYVPNYNAKSLVLNKAFNIGVFFSTLKDGTSADFLYDVIRGVNNVINGEYNLVVSGIEELEHYDSINRKKFNGIILMSQSSKDDPFILKVIEQKIPLVILNRKVEYDKVLNIVSDDYEGAYKATQYFITKGHSDIAIIKGRESFVSTNERYEGYKTALRDFGIKANEEYVVKGNFDLQSGYKAMKELLQLRKIPTAVFCSSDDMAVGAVKAINEAGLRVKEDISIIGFDGSSFVNYLTPVITTIKRPIMEISEEGAKRLINMIDYNKIYSERISINTTLTIGESVKELK